MPTRNEARKAVNKAKLPARDKYVYRSLLDVADNATLVIPDRFQPYRQSDAYLFGLSRRSVQRALADLRLHGWVTWTAKQKARQCGRPPNHYTLSIGTDCACPPERPSIKRQPDAQPAQVKRQDDAPKSARCDPESGVSPAETTKGVREGGMREGETFAATGSNDPGPELEVPPEPPMFVAVPVWMLPRPAPDESWKVWARGTIGYEMNAVGDGECAALNARLSL